MIHPETSSRQNARAPECRAAAYEKHSFLTNAKEITRLDEKIRTTITSHTLTAVFGVESSVDFALLGLSEEPTGKDVFPISASDWQLLSICWLLEAGRYTNPKGVSRYLLKVLEGYRREMYHTAREGNEPPDTYIAHETKCTQRFTTWLLYKNEQRSFVDHRGNLPLFVVRGDVGFSGYQGPFSEYALSGQVLQGILVLVDYVTLYAAAENKAQITTAARWIPEVHRYEAFDKINEFIEGLEWVVKNHYFINAR